MYSKLVGIQYIKISCFRSTLRETILISLVNSSTSNISATNNQQVSVLNYTVILFPLSMFYALKTKIVLKTAADGHQRPALLPIGPIQMHLQMF